MNHTRPMSLYIVVPLAHKNSLKRLVLGQILHRLTEHLEFRDGRAVTGYRHRLLLMIDEFPSLGRLDVFAESLSLVAGYGIKACLIAQDLSQIHAAYGHDEAITSNCHTRVAFAPNRIETARLLSQMTGETTVRHSHRTISSSGASVSEPEVARPLITPDEAMRLGSNEALIFTSGRPAIRATKLRYYSDPSFKRLAQIVANASSPIVEGELPIDGIRFEGLLPPVARKPCCVMRKPAQVLYTLDDYVRDGILHEVHAQVLREAIDLRLNVAVAGGTGSGKTTLAGAMINEMVERRGPNERYVIIEDTLEIQCRAQNLVQLHTAESADMTRLVRTTMRLRPDRIIIGEVRGAEALALLKAWNTGHPGGVTTIHANTAKAALTRLSSLVQEAGVPPQAELIAETINLIVFIVRMPAGRRVSELVRIAGYDVREGFALRPVEVDQGLEAITA